MKALVFLTTIVLSTALYCPGDKYFYRIEKDVNANVESLLATSWDTLAIGCLDADKHLEYEALDHTERTLRFQHLQRIFFKIQNSLIGTFPVSEEAVYDEPSRRAAMLDFITQKKNELLAELYRKPNWNTEDVD